ncbi:MAG: DUF5013 domain-containing protein [Bacteroidaceae bacterium]|nr:DUF5013 domain-containing protein [Bacteroidaceae bacterium]
MKNSIFRKVLPLAVLLLALMPMSMQADWKMANVPIQTKFAADVSPTNALPEYPRPQMVRADWQNLNGLWSYMYLPDYDEEIPEFGSLQILVPYCVESALSGLKTHYECMAYKRDFTVPDAWNGKRVLLNFEAVDWRCTVYVNGEVVGSHDGGYDPFSFDVTDKVKFGQQNEVSLKVFDPTDRWSVPRGKQVRNPGGIFYTACSGIWQTVWMEAVNQTYIEDFHLTPDIDAQTLTINATAAGNTDNVSKIKATAYHGTKKVAETEGQPGEDIVLNIPDPDLWTPDHPFLYDLKLELVDKDGKKDEVQSYFGMRKISLARDKDGFYRMMLNNEFVFQTGPLDQGYWPESNLTPPTDEAIQYDIVQMKKYGFNMVRKHLKVEPRRWYYWTDKLGLMVWQDMPSMNYGGTKDDGVTNDPNIFTPELKAMINLHYNTPSIINWVIFNEAGGQHNTKTYVDLVRSMDKTRLIDEASGWSHYGYGDILDDHPYPAPSAPTATKAQATADGEYGGIKYAIDGHLWKGNGWGYASVESAAAFDSTVCNFFGKLAYYKTYKGLSAAVYTQLTDVEIEVNGMMTYDRLVKTDMNKLYKANRKLIEHEGVEEQYVLSPANITPQSWRYTLTEPGTGWKEADFDDSGWSQGNSGFGANGLSNMTYGTRWNTNNIWLRKNVTLNLTEEELAKLRMIIYNDEDVEVYFNGTMVYSATGYLTDYKTVDFTSAGRQAINREGDNIIAIHVKQTSGGQFIDLGLQVAKDAEERGLNRMVQLNMDYTKSSEISFAVGYSLDLDATEPEVVKSFTRLTFADGEANYIGLNDGALLTPKTVQLDITDFVGELPEGSKIKYFVYVKPQTGGDGEGTIHSCSVVDYTNDPAGVVTPMTFDPVEVSCKTGTIVLTGAASPEAYTAPRNATLSPTKGGEGATLQWDAPASTTAMLQGYSIMADGEEETTVGKTVNSYEVARADAGYTVKAVYTTGVSEPSNVARLMAEEPMTTNVVRHFEENGFSVPDAFLKPHTNATVEYWFKPDTLYANSNQVGPGWGTFLINFDQMARVTAGFENNNLKRVQSSAATIKKHEWNHIAVTIADTRLNLYLNGAWVRTMNVSGYSGMPAIGEFVFGSNKAYINGWIDDVRLWGTARTADELVTDMTSELLNPAAEPDLLAYYKMDEIEVDGVMKLRDCAKGHHAAYLRSDPTTAEIDTSIMQGDPVPMYVAINSADSEVTAGVPLKMDAVVNSSVNNWVWTEPRTRFKKENLQQAAIIFPQAGQYVVSLKATNIMGEELKVSDTITVKAAPLPSVDFDIYQPDKAAGAPVILLNKSDGIATTYRWSIPGSSSDQAPTTYNATAVYPSDGNYTVKLTATNATGTVTAEKELTVSSGVRNMAFKVEPNVVLPSEKVELVENSGAEVDNLVWTIANDKKRTLIQGGTTSFVPTAVGRYDITLTDSETGSTSSLKNGLYVCSAPSKTGLYFRNRGESLTIPTPFTAKTSKMSIEWWMNPSMLLNAGAMRTPNGALSVQTDAKGTVTVKVGNKSFSSPEGFVIANEWHHYAVTLSGSRVSLLRDAEVMASMSPILSCPAWDELVIGGEGTSMAANIDEFRIWGTGLKDDALLAVCNSPVDNVAAAEADGKLLVYYKFDELAAVAKDETSRAADGTLKGFQKVVGTNYVKSDGVFSLNVNTPSEIDDVVDISESYLTNYEAPFLHSATTIEGGAGNYALQSGNASSTWEGDLLPVAEAGVYVTGDADNQLALTTSWNGFASNAIDKVLYQTVTLPVGVYRFEATSAKADNTGDCMLVATIGEKLANLDGLQTTLAAAPLNQGSVTFTVPRPDTNVSLGVLYNVPAYGESAITSFSLYKLPTRIIQANPDDVTAVATQRLENNGSANADKGWYTIDGCKLTAKPTKKGIYIHHGNTVKVK